MNHKDHKTHLKETTPGVSLLPPQDLLKHSRSLGARMVAGKTQFRHARKLVSAGSPFSQWGWDPGETPLSAPLSCRQKLWGHSQGAYWGHAPMAPKSYLTYPSASPSSLPLSACSLTPAPWDCPLNKRLAPRSSPQASFSVFFRLCSSRPQGTLGCV